MWKKSKFFRVVFRDLKRFPATLEKIPNKGFVENRILRRLGKIRISNFPLDFPLEAKNFFFEAIFRHSVDLMIIEIFKYLDKGYFRRHEANWMQPSPTLKNNYSSAESEKPIFQS